MKHSRAITSETMLLREAIKDALEHATEPLSSAQIAQHEDIVALGVSTNRVSQELTSLFQRRRPLFPLSRVVGGQGRPAYGYFIPRPESPPEVNDGNSDFQFNPVEFNPVEFAQDEQRVVLPTAKQITLEVGGVVIRIELTP